MRALFVVGLAALLAACGPFALPGRAKAPDAAAQEEEPAGPRLNAPSTQATVVGTPQAQINAAQRAELEDGVREFLSAAQTRFAPGMSAAPGFPDKIVSLQPGRDDRWQVELTARTAYRVLGGCDNECSNVDIEIIDARGGVVASDLQPDDRPVVDFTPARSGVFTIRILMQTCTLAPCFAGARVLVNQPAGQAL